MEGIPAPPLENPEKRQLFEIIRKMMAKTPAQRFQNAEELVSVLEGGRSVSFTTDATMAMPSLTGVRLASAPTTPLPRATGTRPEADEAPRRSVLSGLLLWLIIVGAVFGGGGFYAYKQGLIFAKDKAGTDSTGASGGVRDTTRLAAGDTGHSTTLPLPPSPPPLSPPPPPPPAPGTPGRLVLQNV